MRGYSAVADNPFFEDESEFELMHIKITVFGLSGILVDHKKGGGPHAPDFSKNLSSGSSLSSIDGSYMVDAAFAADQENTTPVYAVVTHNRNVGNNATSISSHLPSMPFAQPISTFGNVNRHLASWPAQNSSLLLQDHDDDCSLMDQSSFIMQRVMMKEPYDRERHHSRADVPGFVHETVDLAINLKRGSEMIPLGLSSLVISGDEEGPLKMNLPAKAIRFKGKKMVIGNMDVASGSTDTKKGRRRMFSKSVENVSFPGDRSMEYCLEENATLKIALQVIPHSSIKQTEASKIREAHKERRRRERRMRAEHRDDVYRQAVLEKLNRMNVMSPRTADNTSNTTATTTTTNQGNKNNPLSGFGMCSHMLCVGTAGTSSVAKDGKGTGDYEMDNDNVQNYLREHGVSFESSVLSSVSESESESESEDEDARPSLLDTQIVVRKRTPIPTVESSSTKASF